MIPVRMTAKGQITIPQDVREEFGLHAGEDFLLDVSSHPLGLLLTRRRSLSDFVGALPATRPFPGREAVRREAGERAGRHTLRTARAA